MPLCPGTAQVAWEYGTWRMLSFVAGEPSDLSAASFALPFMWGLALFFFPLGILGSAEFVLCFAEERAC